MSSSKNYSNGFWKVYVHINKTNGKRYVGITSQKVEYRWNYGEGYKHSPHLYAAIKKYGWDGFEHIVLFDYLTEQEAKSKETELIAAWNTQDNKHGYNISSGGEGMSGYRPSEEVRQKWSAVRTGKKRSDETKQRISENSVFRCPERRDEVIRKIAESKYKPVTAISLDGSFLQTYPSIKHAANALGLSEAHRSRISECCKGKRKSTGGFRWQYA